MAIKNNVSSYFDPCSSIKSVFDCCLSGDRNIPFCFQCTKYETCATSYFAPFQQFCIFKLRHQLIFYYNATYTLTGADQGFLEMGFICIKVWGFALLILSHFS